MTTDERLDALDLEIIGLQRIQAREIREALARRGYDVERYVPIPFPHPSETSTAKTARAGSRVAPALRIDSASLGDGATTPRA